MLELQSQTLRTVSCSSIRSSNSSWKRYSITIQRSQHRRKYSSSDTASNLSSSRTNHQSRTNVCLPLHHHNRVTNSGLLQSIYNPLSTIRKRSYPTIPPPKLHPLLLPPSQTNDHAHSHWIRPFINFGYHALDYLGVERVDCLCPLLVFGTTRYQSWF